MFKTKSMFKNKRSAFIQAIGLLVFCFMAVASSSSKEGASNIDWGEAVRGGTVGGIAGYNGMVCIGSASSESEATELADSKGYTTVIWDSVNGRVYAK